jgi:hypothetical protein
MSTRPDQLDGIVEMRILAQLSLRPGNYRELLLKVTGNTKSDPKLSRAIKRLKRQGKIHCYERVWYRRCCGECKRYY